MGNKPKIDRAAKPTTIKVDKNIPMPARMFKRDDRFPFLDMEPKDSFFVSMDFDGEDVSAEVFAKRMAARAQAAGKRAGNGCRFIARKVVERQGAGLVHGVRIWRVE